MKPFLKSARLRALLASAVCLCAAASASAHDRFYHWIGEDGIDHFSNDWKAVPAAVQDEYGKKGLAPTASQQAEAERKAPAASQPQKEEQKERRWSQELDLVLEKLKKEQANEEKGKALWRNLVCYWRMRLAEAEAKLAEVESASLQSRREAAAFGKTAWLKQAEETDKARAETLKKIEEARWQLENSIPAAAKRAGVSSEWLNVAGGCKDGGAGP